MMEGSSSNPSSVKGESTGLLIWWKNLWSLPKGDANARDVLEELIEERIQLANILELRSRTIRDVMLPRADITCINVDASLHEVTEVLTKDNHSRLPVYKENLDDAVGMVHIKDVLAWSGRENEFSLKNIQRKILFVSPSMQVLELLLEMRAKRSHMALVVDEFGGVDGLVTIEDLVEEIVGEIEDDHHKDNDPRLTRNSDGSFVADARFPIDLLEGELGTELTVTDGEDIDTLGGLVFSLAGRVPIRGELIRHMSGIEFEVLDADPRRIKSLRILGSSKLINRDANEE